MSVPKRNVIPTWAVKILFVLLFLSVLVFIWAIYSYFTISKLIATQQAPAVSQQWRLLAEKEVNDLAAKVSRHIILPQGEIPLAITVVDAVGLAKSQPFFEDAQNGDKVLVYYKAQKVFLYSPSRDVVLNVGPLIIISTSTIERR